VGHLTKLDPLPKFWAGLDSLHGRENGRASHSNCPRGVMRSRVRRSLSDNDIVRGELPPCGTIPMRNPRWSRYSRTTSTCVSYAAEAFWRAISGPQRPVPTASGQLFATRFGFGHPWTWIYARRLTLSRMSLTSSHVKSCVQSGTSVASSGRIPHRGSSLVWHGCSCCSQIFRSNIWVSYCTISPAILVLLNRPSR
jgi:hypothetical protein